MRVPDEVLKCVVFLYVKKKDKNDTEHYSPVGTGFFVQMQSEDDSTVSINYLVTAKHCVENLSEDLFVRVNNKNGSANWFTISKVERWFAHEENDVDLAVIPFGPIDVMEYKAVPTLMFLEDRHLEHAVNLGDEVFITGLFTRHYGQSKNLPIVRTGTIAMLSSEKVFVGKWHGGVYIEAYLIEARSIGGLSGSPVFFVKGRTDEGNISLGGQAFVLGGVIHGHWPVDESKIDGVFDSLGAESERNVNMGIAIVTPAKKLMEVLNTDEVRNHRRQATESFKNKPAPTTLD